ncbi:unnamed protein product [Paramecium pentaurelia]|uniref:RING-type E3 ubiquitin transferase n=1 Tax=Paramecium pentaurelia TaxID=43138 RepID=A0A8S1T0E4_9CILI|nr:unnamed protein product [Paramecium pentaurelia]
MELLQKFISLYFLLLYLPQVNLQNVNSTEQLMLLLNKELFSGKWWSNNPSIYQFNYLTLDSGMIKVKFVGNSIQFVALNPKYYEDKHVYGEFLLTNYSESSQAWIGESKLLLEGSYSRSQPWIESFCNGTYIVKLNQKLENLDLNQLQIDVDLKSNPTFLHCQIDMSFNVKRVYDFSFINNLIFCMMATMILTVQYLLSKQLLDQLKYRLIEVEQMSRLTLFFSLFQGLSLFYLFVEILFQNFYNYYLFILPTFIQFLQIFKNQAIFGLVWSQRLQNAFVERREYKKKLVIMYLIIWITTIVNMILFNIFGQSFYYMFTQAFILYPQIIHNLRQGNKYQFNKIYIFGLLSSKFFFYLYLRSCPVNVLGLKPDYLFVGEFIAIYFFSLLLIILQSKYGSRCLIPKCLKPKKFQFLQKVKVNNEMECPICLNHLYLNPIDTDDKPLEKSLICQIMVTPCQHSFHQQCLESWINVQKNCPICRKIILRLDDN